MSGQTVLQFQRAAQKRAWGDPGGLCRREDLVGREMGRDKVTYEADGDGKHQVAIQLG